LLQLQQTIGNRAVGRFIQAKLKINRPGDVYEQEADRVADEVMRMPEPTSHDISPHSSPAVTPIVESHINSMRGGGQPLPESARTFFEPRFGYDFNQIRVHADAQAAASARQINALAYTLGQDIVFGAGQYTPHTFEGRRLIAHELTHVLQQNQEPPVIRRKIQFASPTYIRENPIDRILSNKPVGYTTPTVNGNPFPEDFNTAGELVFQALQAKETTYNAKTKECTFKDFDVTVSANVIIPTEPEGGRWTMNFPGSGITEIPACRDKKSVPVVMTGKPSSEAAGKWIEKNEDEHVDDLKKLYQKHLEPHFDWLLKLKANGEDGKKCQEALMKALGNKDAIAIRDFLKDLAEAVKKRDEGGKHTLSNKIKDKNNCSGVEIESSTK
jgi:hypothetical protein